MECTCYIKVLMLIAKHKVNWNVLDHMILDTSLIPVCINLQVNLNKEASLIGIILRVFKNIIHSSIESLNKYSSQNISHLFETEVP